jgi:hypothetical protein
MDIKLLSKHPEYIRDVSDMVYNEFVLKSGSKMTFDEVQSYFSNTKTTQFPITLIAVTGNVCVGTVSIFENDFKERPQYMPWLASSILSLNTVVMA